VQAAALSIGVAQVAAARRPSFRGAMAELNRELNQQTVAFKKAYRAGVAAQTGAG